jgi:hypothetical protein
MKVDVSWLGAPPEQVVPLGVWVSLLRGRGMGGGRRREEECRTWMYEREPIVRHSDARVFDRSVTDRAMIE